MESRMLVDVEKKYTIGSDDQFVVEDEDGTKTVKFSVIQSALQKTMVCDTINNLKALSLPQGVIIKTLGYHKINDGGAATYFIDYDPSAVDDGALCHYLTSSDTLRAKLVQEGSINVLAFGAVGDGLNDDHEAIQKAIDSGLPIYFPNKTYKISSALNISSNTSIDFNGSTITCPTSDAFIVGSVATGATNVRISNVHIIGFNGIEVMPKSNKIIFENISITGQTSNSEYGFRLLSDDDIEILNCSLSGLKYGVTVYVSNGITKTGFILVSNSVIDTSVQGIRTTGGATNTTHITVSNCNLIGVKKSSESDSAVYLNSQNDIVNLTNCVISNAYAGIYITSSMLNIINIVKCTYTNCTNDITNNDSGTTVSTI